MAWLLIDNSNSRTKFSLADAEGFCGWRGWLPTAEVTEKNLDTLLQSIHFEAVICASVVPAKAALMKAYFEPKAISHWLDHQSPIGMVIDYPRPWEIGADRLANAAGVHGKSDGPMVVIDFGTAVTFDVISDAPAYCGGVIAPGLGSMSGYLSQKTALLPIIELEEPASAIGKSTVQAMLAGAVYGYRGLIKEIIAEISKELGEKPYIIATGGDAVLISKGLKEVDEVDRLVTIKGLRRVAMRLFPN